MDPTFLKKKSINFSLLQTLTTTNWIITKKKDYNHHHQNKKKWLKINYLLFYQQHLSGVTIFLWKYNKKNIIITTTTTNYFFCFLNDQKPALSELPDPPSPQSPCVFWSIFSWEKKIVQLILFLQVVLMGFYFDFRATESEWCDIFHPLKLIIIIIIIITTFYYFTKLFVY